MNGLISTGCEWSCVVFASVGSPKIEATCSLPSGFNHEEPERIIFGIHQSSNCGRVLSLL